ncbi:MAG: hypothetical protein MZW92_21075 [Comamonadaceae bacterium]|nr:hypothetical protein [Comamonadaceae bacterium]
MPLFDAHAVLRPRGCPHECRRRYRRPPADRRGRPRAAEADQVVARPLRLGHRRDRESALLQFRRHQPAVVTMDLGPAARPGLGLRRLPAARAAAGPRPERQGHRADRPERPGQRAARDRRWAPTTSSPSPSTPRCWG